MLGEYCASRPACWSDYKPGHVLRMPTPPVFACYSDIILNRKRGDGLIRHNAVRAFAVFVLMQFFGAAWDAIVALPCADNPVGLSGCDLLVPFPAQTQKRIKDLGFL